MNLSRRSIRATLRFGLCFLTTILTLNATRSSAQEVLKNVATIHSTSAESTVNERVRILEGELEKQGTKIDELQKTIEDQQRAIQSLLARFSDNKTPVIVATAETAASNTASG